MKFELYENELLKIKEWDKTHNNGECHNMYCGTVGGRLIYGFIRTSLGDLIVVTCTNCKEEITLYDQMD